MEEIIRLKANYLGDGQHKIICPSCNQTRKKKNQKTLSVKVNSDSIVYQCWHCSASGEVKYNYNSKRESKVIDMFEVDRAKETWQNLGKSAMSFLKNRGISEKTATHFNIKQKRNYIANLGDVDCVVFPYGTDENISFVKIRSCEGKGFASQGSADQFYNIDIIDEIIKSEKKELIICEGEMDALSYHESGITNVISIPSGAVAKIAHGKTLPHEDTKFKFIWNAIDKINEINKIVLSMDSDDAGVAMSEELARRLGKHRCYKVRYPEDCKDANDVLQRHGKKILAELPDKAEPYPVSGLYNAQKFANQLMDIYDNGHGTGVSTGYENLDELYTIVQGQLSIVTGHPSSGKSEFIDQVMYNIAKKDNWKFAVCSFENEPRIHIAKLISKHLGKPFFKGATNRMTKEELKEGLDFVRKHFFFLYQADGSLSTIDSIIERLKISVQRYGCRGAIIDPYNYISKHKMDKETDWVSEMLSSLRSFAQAHDIHIWFVAHPTKMMRREDGTIPVPRGYDISGSASFFSKADCGVTIDRPDPSKTTQTDVHIWKCRYSWVGKQGKTSFTYDRIKSRYDIYDNDSMLAPKNA